MTTIVPATNATAGPFRKVVGAETAESGARPGMGQGGYFLADPVVA